MSEMLYIKRVELKDFRCFEHMVLEADVSTLSAPWTLLTGDNASGKTTLLKAIALGLCDRSSAAGLLRESDSGYIRNGKDSSQIRIELTTRPAKGPPQDFTVTTCLTRLTSNLERLEQCAEPDPFPWNDIFVCGYGAGRGTAGTGDIAGYTAISAVYNLFNYSEGLQNPELTIHRLQRSKEQVRGVIKTAERVLRLSNLRLAEGAEIDSGMLVTDPRGVEVAMRDLADGYKSTFLWLTDFIGWALAKQATDIESLKGIVIIDELEQHLHPQWQRRIVPTLKQIWPQIQFFAATHSPLVAKSFHSSDSDRVNCHYHLSNSVDESKVEATKIPPLTGMRTDQILASPAFDFLLDDDPDADEILQTLAVLADHDSLANVDQERATELAAKVKEIQSVRKGQTDPEQYAAQWGATARRELIERLSREIRGG